MVHPAAHVRALADFRYYSDTTAGWMNPLFVCPLTERAVNFIVKEAADSDEQPAYIILNMRLRSTFVLEITGLALAIGIIAVVIPFLRPA